METAQAVTVNSRGVMVSTKLCESCQCFYNKLQSIKTLDGFLIFADKCPNFSLTTMNEYYENFAEIFDSSNE